MRRRRAVAGGFDRHRQRVAPLPMACHSSRSRTWPSRWRAGAAKRAAAWAPAMSPSSIPTSDDATPPPGDVRPHEHAGNGVCHHHGTGALWRHAPWNPDFARAVPGGGAAAAVAAKPSRAAGPCDGRAAGFRVPAASTGLFGLKPSRGRVSNGPAMDEIFSGLGVQLGVSRSATAPPCSTPCRECTAGRAVCMCTATAKVAGEPGTGQAAHRRAARRL